MSVPRRGFLVGGVAASMVGLAGWPAVAAGRDLRLGVLLDLSGPTSVQGKRQLVGVRFAAQRLAACEGLPTLELSIWDTAGEVEQAREGAWALFGEADIPAIIGPSSGRTAPAVAEIAAAARKPMVVPVGGNLAPSPFVFQAGAALGPLFRTLVADLGPGTVALLRQADAATAPPTQFIDGLTAAGASVVGYQSVATSDQLPDALRTLMATRPDAIRTSAYPPFNGLVAVAARELGWDGRLYFGPAAGHPGFLETAGPAAEGVRITAPWSLVAAQAPQTVPNKLVMTSFIQDFERAHGPAGVYVGFAADAVHLLATALATAAGPDQTRLVLENLAMVGVCGVYQMTPDNHNGLRDDSLTTVTVHNGQFVPGGRQ